MNKLIARTALLLVLAAVALAGCRQPVASPSENRDYLGGTQSVSLYLVSAPHEEDRWLELDTAAGVEKLPYWGGVVLPDGSLVLSDPKRGMYRRYPDGKLEKLLDRLQTGGAIYLDATSRYVAYIYPLRWDDKDRVTSSGVGLYDLETNESCLLASHPYVSGVPVGWVGDRILCLWFSSMCEGSLPQYVDLRGNIDPLLVLPGVWATRFLVVRNDQFVYETLGQKVVVVWDLITDTRTEFVGAENVRWTRDGLEATLNGQRQLIYEMGP